MLRRLQLDRYRCHENLSINLKPLTILVGENNSGKSAVLEAIWFLKRASASKTDTVIRSIEKEGAHPLGYQGSEVIGLDYVFEPDLRDKEELSPSPRSRESLGVRIVLREGRLASHEVTMNMNPIIKIERNVPKLLTNIFSETPSMAKFQGPSEFDRVLAWEASMEDAHSEEEKTSFMTFNIPKNLLLRKVENIFYQPPHRYPGKGTVGIDDIGGTDIEDGRLTSPRVHTLHSRKDGRFQDLEGMLKELDEDVGGIISDWLGTEETTILLETALGPFDIEAMGDGLKRAMPLLVQLVLAPEDGIILIEEPEANLHPRAIRIMAHILSMMVRSGKQIIFSTHSGDLIHWFWEMVKEDEAFAQEIALYVFEKDSKGGRSQEELKLVGVAFYDLLDRLRIARFESE